tara:strand:+ start:3253 stop:3918 length:666 start_codon:yes stop_codon:yes gene_type:complete
MDIKTAGKFVATLIVSFALVVSFYAKAETNSPHIAHKPRVISDLNTVSSFSQNIVANKISVRSELLYQATEKEPYPRLLKTHSPESVKRIIKASADILDIYLRERGIGAYDCRGEKYNLIIYVVDPSVLADRRRFRHLYHNHGGEALYVESLYGYYTSTPEIENNSTIIVTDINSSKNEQILAHEMAHYWWDRLCLTQDIQKTSEAFAQDFHNYYMKKVSR